MKLMEIPKNSRNFSKFSEFCIFQAIHPPESLIFLRNYWCFRDPAIFAEILISNEKFKISEKIIKFPFSQFLAKNHILRKMGPGAPKTPKKVWNCIGFIRPGAPGPRGTKKREKLRQPRKIFCGFYKNYDFHVKFWEILKKHHFAPSQNVGIPCKILYKLKSAPPF